ncbi:heme ABC transporter ATP-binding protein [Caldimonas brevitalea]|uniref:Heme ABC transporter ATP-binding protein n=1 Tax=Caldimonas brevitalea TaxID=413882 RepID=A0A0G3BRK4_9BURK|nr:heme ABC transporter ATP-binding protein [Caldimonas brevitalea]
MVPLAVQLRGIRKRFGNVWANDGVDLEVARGSIHGLVGENGAGKSTLMGILYGLHEADEGEVCLDGRPVRLRSAQEALRHGVGMVHQHFMLVDRFTVLENVVLGAEGGFALRRGMAQAQRELERLGREFGLAVDPRSRVADLPVGALQRVEILKALYRGARILILDEPTGVLTPAETEQLFAVLRDLKARGVTVLLVTHKLKEILAVTDGVTVMRAGRVVATCRTADTREQQLAQWMVGRQVLPVARSTEPRGPGEVRLQADGLWWHDTHGVARLRDVTLTLRAGEIVGVAGVAGNGQSELLAVLAGLLAAEKGRLCWTLGDGRQRELHAPQRLSPRELRHLGVAHVPEDRHRLGLVLGLPAWESALLGYEDDPAVHRGRWLSPAAMRAQCRRLMAAFDVRPPEPSLQTSKFSGGNQQKLILAREFARAPRVLLIGQPTRGVDIGAIEYIHRQIAALREAGCAVLLVSTELDEILALADRIVVMSGGRITGNLAREEASEARLGALMGTSGGGGPAEVAA